MDFTLENTSDGWLRPPPSHSTHPADAPGPSSIQQRFCGGLTGRLGAVVPSVDAPAPVADPANDWPSQVSDRHCDDAECQEIPASTAAAAGEACSDELQYLQGLILRASQPGMAVTDTMRAGFELMRKCVCIAYVSSIDQWLSPDELEELEERIRALEECAPAKQAHAILIRATATYLTCIALPSASLEFAGMAVTWGDLQALERARCEMLANAELWSSILMIYATARSRCPQEVEGADLSKGIDVGTFPLTEVHEDDGWGQESREWQLNISGKALTTSTFTGALMFWCELLFDYAGAYPVMLKHAGEYLRLLEESKDKISSLDAVTAAIEEQDRARDERQRRERRVLRGG